MSQQSLMMGEIEEDSVCYAEGVVAHRMRKDGRPEFDLQELKTIVKCWNAHSALLDALKDAEAWLDAISKRDNGLVMMVQACPFPAREHTRRKIKAAIELAEP